MFTTEVMYAILLVNDYKEKERYEMKKLFIVLLLTIKIMQKEINKMAIFQGKEIRKKNIVYLTCGPIIAMVLEGHGVISGVRKILGSTSPADGDVGTIRDDYSFDTYVLADYISRATRTMLHASDSVENANREIKIWFKENELCDNYETVAEKIFFDFGWDHSEK